MFFERCSNPEFAGNPSDTGTWTSGVIYDESAYKGTMQPIPKPAMLGVTVQSMRHGVITTSLLITMEALL